jgi:hypothetical protein
VDQEGGPMIPKVIHFVWIGERALPAWAAETLSEWERLNPGWEVRLHGDEACLPEFAQLYAEAPIINRSDILRYSIIQRYGGWYFDVDMYPLRGLDGAAEAWGLDGSRVLIAEQHGNRNASLTHNPTPIAGTPDAPLWPVLNEALLSVTRPLNWVRTGPELCTRLVKEHPALWRVAGWPWFCPAGIGDAGALWEICRRDGPEVMRRVAPTGGQLPYAMHLWAGAGKDGGIPVKSSRSRAILTPDPAAERPLGLRVCLSCMELQWADETQPFQAIAEGLARIGCTVDVRDLDDSEGPALADLVVVWNGRRGPYRAPIEAARRHGIPALVAEHGFFDRRAHTHFDHRDILHWASWAGDWDRPAPGCGAERLARVWPQPLQPFERREGYVLVLGQLQGDAQMQESEINESTTLCRWVKRSLPPRVRGEFRPHPKQARPARVELLPRCEAGSLEEAVAGARFAVTVNSNGGNEALALGCPVLCLGPALYARAGVALQTSGATFKRYFDTMLSGWRPETDAVRNYLEWLACRQFSQADIREGEMLRRLLKAAGVRARDGSEAAA